METAVGACNYVHYLVDIRYSECPLIESTVLVPWLVTSDQSACSIGGVYI